MKKKKIIPLARKHDLKRGVDYIGVNVVFYCHDGKGNILLHKRSQQCRDELGRWDSGAGSMEFGESFADAVTREVFEEYGVKPKKIEYVMTKNVLRDNAGTNTHWVVNMHMVHVDPKKVKNNDPKYIDELGWFSIDNLPSPLHSQLTKEVPFLRLQLRKKRAITK